jgi:hypothetical protein
MELPITQFIPLSSSLIPLRPIYEYIPWNLILEHTVPVLFSECV